MPLPLLICLLGKAPDKPHVNPIPKGKLDFRFFCNPDCRLATHPGELHDCVAIPNQIEIERNTCINNLFCFSDLLIMDKTCMYQTCFIIQFGGGGGGGRGECCFCKDRSTCITCTVHTPVHVSINLFSVDNDLLKVHIRRAEQLSTGYCHGNAQASTASRTICTSTERRH